MRRLLPIVLVTLALTACGGGTPATPTPEPTVEYKLAIIHGEGDHDPAVETEFARILDQIQEGGSICAPERDRERAADTLVASWEESGKQDSLLVWARTLAELCE